MSEKHKELFKKGIPIIHCSMLGGPIRSSVLKLMGEEGDPISPQLQKAFDDGRKYEDVALKQTGAPYIKKYEDVDSYMERLVKLKSGIKFYLRGSTDAELSEDWMNDGVIHPKGTILEVKNMSPRNFSRMRNVNQIKKNYPKYYYQVQSYLYFHEKMDMFSDYALMIIRNKKSKDIRILKIPKSKEAQRKVLKICEEIARHIIDKTLPECTCEDSWCRMTRACRNYRMAEESSSGDTEYIKEQQEMEVAYIFNATGTSFRKKVIEKLAKESTEAPKVSLEYDPDNEYDPNAIKVMVNGEHVGFVPAIYQKHYKELSIDHFPQIVRMGLSRGNPFVTILLRRR